MLYLNLTSACESSPSDKDTPSVQLLKSETPGALLFLNLSPHSLHFSGQPPPGPPTCPSPPGPLSPALHAPSCGTMSRAALWLPWGPGTRHFPAPRLQPGGRFHVQVHHSHHHGQQLCTPAQLPGSAFVSLLFLPLNSLCFNFQNFPSIP